MKQNRSQYVEHKAWSVKYNSLKIVTEPLTMSEMSQYNTVM